MTCCDYTPIDWQAEQSHTPQSCCSQTPSLAADWLTRSAMVSRPAVFSRFLSALFSWFLDFRAIFRCMLRASKSLHDECSHSLTASLSPSHRSDSRAAQHTSSASPSWRMLAVVLVGPDDLPAAIHHTELTPGRLTSSASPSWRMLAVWTSLWCAQMIFPLPSMEATGSSRPILIMAAPSSKPIPTLHPAVGTMTLVRGS